MIIILYFILFHIIFLRNLFHDSINIVTIVGWDLVSIFVAHSVSANRKLVIMAATRRLQKVC